MREINMLIAAALTLTMAVAMVNAATGGPSPVPAPPGYNLTTTATVLCRGETNYLPIVIRNYGTGSIGAMQDTTFALATTEGLFASTLNVGTVPANSTKTYYLPVFVSANASLYIPTGITINYFYYSVYTDSEISNMSFTTRACAQPIVATISPTVLTAGAIENITFKVANDGPDTLNSLSVSLAMPSLDAALLGAQPVSINSIAPYSSMQFNQSVYVSRNATQNFPANLTVDYYNGASLSQAWNDTQLLTIGIINITTSGLTLSPTVPSPGSVFSISLVLTNTGTSTADAVTAAVAPSNGFSPYDGNSVFVGSIGPDSQAPVTLTLTASPSVANGQYQIPIRISYLNSLRQNVTQNTAVPVQLAPAAANATVASMSSYHGSGSGLILLILIIVIIVLLVLYNSERKKNRRHTK